MTQALVPQPGLRALDVLNAVPAGCMAVRDVDGLCEPHIRTGEFAIADTADREPQHGELFLLRWSNGRMSILQAKLIQCDIGDGPQPTWWVCPLPGARKMATSDGPYRDAERLKAKIVGRIVGVMADHLAG